MIFSDIIINHDIKERIVERLRRKAFPSSVLFSENGGYGALVMALAAARFLVCEKAEEDTCNVCKNCLKANAFAHPDIHFTFPFINLKQHTTCHDFSEKWRTLVLNDPYLCLEDWLREINSENKQALINMAEVQQLIEKLSYEPYESTNKVSIVWLPEYLGKNANVLLKMVEEPPHNTYFIFVAQNSSAILPTLKSRLMQFSFPPLSNELLQQYARKHLNEEIQENNIMYAKGSIDLLKRIRNGNENYRENFDLMSMWFRTIYKKDIEAIFLWMDNVAAFNREKIKGFLFFTMEMLQQTLYQKQALDKLIFLKDKQKEFLENFSKILQVSQIESILACLDEAYLHVERNANNKIMMIDVSLSIMKIFRPTLFSIKN